MLNCARGACFRRGYPINDPEYGSAIGLAVWRAAQRWEPGKGCKPTTLAAVYGLQICHTLKRKLDRHSRRSEELNERELRQRWQPVPTPIPLTDSELLGFTALHGITRAAKLLMMPNGQLRERLDETRLRVHQSREESYGSLPVGQARSPTPL